jgi:hypothetical protein
MFKKFKAFIKKLLAHKCDSHLKVISTTYHKCGMTGIITMYDRTYECTKCGKIHYK